MTNPIHIYWSEKALILPLLLNDLSGGFNILSYRAFSFSFRTSKMEFHCPLICIVLEEMPEINLIFIAQ